MNYKIVFFDVDGTLTDYTDGSISNKTKESIQSLKEKGLLVVAATGRPLSMCEELKELGIDTFITANGAYAKHHHEVIHKVPIEKEVIKEVFDFASVENHGLSFFTEELSMNGVKDTEILKALQQTLFLNNYPPINLKIYEEETYLMCLYADESMVDKYVERFPHLTFSRWHPFITNVLQEDVCKSLAVRKVLEYFGIDPSEAIAFGDGENDIDMLKLVGLGVAMGNGHEKLKSVANFVTKKSSEDGIHFALEHYGVI